MHSPYSAGGSSPMPLSRHCSHCGKTVPQSTFIIARRCDLIGTEKWAGCESCFDAQGDAGSPTPDEVAMVLKTLDDAINALTVGVHYTEVDTIVTQLQALRDLTKAA